METPVGLQSVQTMESLQGLAKNTLSRHFDTLKRATYTSLLINIYSSKWALHMRFFLFFFAFIAGSELI